MKKTVAIYLICGRDIKISYSSKNYNDSSMMNHYQQLAKVFKGLTLVKLENNVKTIIYPTPEVIKLRQRKRKQMFEGFLQPCKR